MELKGRYPHLQLLDWPFRLVPDESFYSFMADRTRLVSDIESLLRALARHAGSTIHLMWAWFGAGKTHTLRYIEHLCKTKFINIIPIYIEFPKSAKNFLDVYMAFLNRINLEMVNSAFEEVFTSPKKNKIQRELQFDFPELLTALKLLYQGNSDQREIVIRWLRTECREKQILRRVGLVRPIQLAEDAVKVISWLIRLMSEREALSGKFYRMLWMIDEYQRIEKLRRPAIDEINGCVHSIFNKCPNELSIIISFSGYPGEQRFPIWLSPEIKDRIGIEKPLLLPPLLREEVFSFVRDVLQHFRNPSSTAFNEYFPFRVEATERIIEIIEDKARKAKREDQPKPRTVMQFFNVVLREADPLIEEGKMETIDGEFADMVLRDVSLLEEE